MSINKFCQRCDGLLHPQEDKEQRALAWACHQCEYKELADTNLTYSRLIQPQATNDGTVAHDATLDPVLPCTRNVRCPFCNYNKGVYFYKAKAGGEMSTSLFFVCSKCAQRWQERPKEEQCNLFKMA